MFHSMANLASFWLVNNMSLSRPIVILSPVAAEFVYLWNVPVPNRCFWSVQHMPLVWPFLIENVKRNKLILISCLNMFYIFYLQWHDFFGIRVVWVVSFSLLSLLFGLCTLFLVSWWDFAARFAATALNFMEVRIASQDMWWWRNVAKLEIASKTSLETDCVQHIWVLKDWIFLKLNITGSLEMWILKWAAPELRFSMQVCYPCKRLPACPEYAPQNIWRGDSNCFALAKKNDIQNHKKSNQIKSILFIKSKFTITLLQWTLQSVQSTSSVLEPSFTLSNSNMLLNVSLKG